VSVGLHPKLKLWTPKHELESKALALRLKKELYIKL